MSAATISVGGRMTAEELVEHFRGCRQGLRSVKGKTITDAWEQCENSEWMLWALKKIGLLDGPPARLLAVRFVRRVEHLMNDERSKKALDVAERYAGGLASDDELNAARDAAKDAWSAMDTAWYAAYAAYAASYASSYAAAVGVGVGAAKAEERKARCLIIREFFPASQIERLGNHYAA
jgi:hypothetical protein